MLNTTSSVPIFGPGDGCTLWFDGWLGVSWRHCCDTHDIAYSLGLDRALADEALRQCVIETGAFLAPVIATVMFIAVRLMGGLFHGRDGK